MSIEIQTEQDLVLKKKLQDIDWTIDWGSVKIQIRDGKVSMVTIERTIRLD